MHAGLAGILLKHLHAEFQEVFPHPVDQATMVELASRTWQPKAQCIARKERSHEPFRRACSAPALSECIITFFPRNLELKLDTPGT